MKGAEENTELGDADAEMLREIARALLEGGIAMTPPESANEGVELEDLEVVWGRTAAELAQFTGSPASGALVYFAADSRFDSTMALVYSQSLETRMTGLTGEEPLVTEAEMRDILEGFTPDDEPDHAVGPSGPTAPLPDNLAVIMDIELVATARLGKVEVPLSDVLNFGPGSIIEVGQSIDDPVELLVNDRLIARGEVVVVDEKFGLRITEIVSPQERIESLS